MSRSIHHQAPSILFPNTSNLFTSPLFPATTLAQAPSFLSWLSAVASLHFSANLLLNQFFTPQPERAFENSNLFKPSHSSLLPLEIKSNPFDVAFQAPPRTHRSPPHSLPCRLRLAQADFLSVPGHSLHLLVPLGLCTVCSFHWENPSPPLWASFYGSFRSHVLRHVLQEALPDPPLPQAQVACLLLCSRSTMCSPQHGTLPATCLWPAHPFHSIASSMKGQGPSCPPLYIPDM